jgi:hypothetical protein
MCAYWKGRIHVDKILETAGKARDVAMKGVCNGSHKLGEKYKYMRCDSMFIIMSLGSVCHWALQESLVQGG